MKKDLESLIFCKLIVEELNERLISKVDSKYLLDFVQSFIYQITSKDAKYTYYYGETYLKGKFEKYNNNDGWFSDTSEHSKMA
jgi:hypothetical protein